MNLPWLSPLQGTEPTGCALNITSCPSFLLLLKSTSAGLVKPRLIPVSLRDHQPYEAAWVPSLQPGVLGSDVGRLLWKLTHTLTCADPQVSRMLPLVLSGSKLSSSAKACVCGESKENTAEKKVREWGNTPAITEMSVYPVTAGKLPRHVRAHCTLGSNPFPHFSYPLAGGFGAYCRFNISFCSSAAFFPRHPTRSCWCWLAEMPSLYHGLRLASSFFYSLTQMPGIAVLVETCFPLLLVSPSDFSFSPKYQTWITLRLCQPVQPDSSSSSY